VGTTGGRDKHQEKDGNNKCNNSVTRIQGSPAEHYITTRKPELFISCTSGFNVVADSHSFAFLYEMGSAGCVHNSFTTFNKSYFPHKQADADCLFIEYLII